MIADGVVLAAVVLAVAFVMAWLVSPELRARIERPKHAFSDAAKEYDRAQDRHRHVPEKFTS